MQQTEAKLAQPGRYLSFILAHETYAIPIATIVEITGFSEVTPVPNTPAFVKGVLNLRGRVIPIVDLRLKFHLPAAPYTKETCIIVTETWGRHIGIIVDNVQDVLELSQAEIEPTPDLGAREHIRFISGIGKKNDNVIILIDINAALSPDEMGQLPTA